MNPIIKIPRPLLKAVLDDLERPHRFAAERLGFISFRQSLHSKTPFLLCHEYHSIPDEQYIYDETCGGRIDGNAIRSAMGRAFREQCGQLWVHMHGRRGIPGPSPTDLEEGPKVVQSLANAQPKVFQGWAVISEDGIAGAVRHPSGDYLDDLQIAVTGWPMVIPRRPVQVPVSKKFFGIWEKPRREVADYDRQSFLGPDSQRIFNTVKVGIIGLGGGGSHINQQLAHIGFQNVVLCDDDRVERTNLNRLVGATLKDALKKRFKTEVAARLFKSLQPDANIDSRPLRWQEKLDALRECDLIFSCLDSFPARRDIESFCRSLMIPLIDIGMIVLQPSLTHEICGQAIVSMPGEPCMTCLQFLTEENLAKDAQGYGAGSQPQVVWPNGVLASTAVGYAVALLTGWSGAAFPTRRLDHRGSLLTVQSSNLAVAIGNGRCKHYPLGQAGDAVFKKL